MPELETPELETPELETPELETRFETDPPETDSLKNDQKIMKALADSHMECEYEMAMDQRDPLLYDPYQNALNALELVYHSIDNQRLIPLIIVRDITKPTLYATLSRDPGWMGMSPALPMLDGLQAVVMTFKHHRPTLILAILDDSPNDVITTLPEHPQRNGKNVSGMDSLVRVLEYHGATPRFMYRKRPEALK